MRIIFKLFIVCFIVPLSGQDLLYIEVNSSDYDRINCPISLDILDSISESLPENLQLVEIIGKSRKKILSQFDKGDKTKIWFVLDGTTPKHTIRNFVLTKASKSDDRNQNDQIDLLMKEGAL